MYISTRSCSISRVFTGHTCMDITQYACMYVCILCVCLCIVTESFCSVYVVFHKRECKYLVKHHQRNAKGKVTAIQAKGIQ